MKISIYVLIYCFIYLSVDIVLYSVFYVILHQNSASTKY